MEEKTKEAWKPTEDELNSIGFNATTIPGIKRIDLEDDDNCAKSLLFYPHGEFRVVHFGAVRLHPKSLEELKTLISMMNP